MIIEDDKKKAFRAVICANEKLCQFLDKEIDTELVKAIYTVHKEYLKRYNYTILDVIEEK